jgi:hypothetical protein
VLLALAPVYVHVLVDARVSAHVRVCVYVCVCVVANLSISLCRFTWDIGNEGDGMRPLVARVCDRTVAIGPNLPSAADSSSSNVDSLNVAAAAAVLVHRWHSTSVQSHA